MKVDNPPFEEEIKALCLIHFKNFCHSNTASGGFYRHGTPHNKTYGYFFKSTMLLLLWIFAIVTNVTKWPNFMLLGENMWKIELSWQDLICVYNRWCSDEYDIIMYSWGSDLIWQKWCVKHLLKTYSSRFVIKIFVHLKEKRLCFVGCVDDRK